MMATSQNLTSVAITVTRNENLEKAKKMTGISKQAIVETALKLIGITDKKTSEKQLKQVLGAHFNSLNSSTRNRTDKAKLNHRSCA
jgi:hypothetical protein